MRRTLIALAFAAPLTAFAANPTIDKITATPSQAKVGEPVTITIEAEGIAEPACEIESLSRYFA